jgi:hypothetical protein
MQTDSTSQERTNRKKVVLFEGSFPGLTITRAALPVSGCSLDFLDYVHARTRHLPTSRATANPDLQRLLAHYRQTRKGEKVT